jgi:hypothetical protein
MFAVTESSCRSEHNCVNQSVPGYLFSPDKGRSQEVPEEDGNQHVYDIYQEEHPSQPQAEVLNEI